MIAGRSAGLRLPAGMTMASALVSTQHLVHLSHMQVQHFARVRSGRGAAAQAAGQAGRRAGGRLSESGPSQTQMAGLSRTLCAAGVTSTGFHGQWAPTCPSADRSRTCTCMRLSQDPRQSRVVLIQGGANRGKSLACKPARA